MAPRPPLSRKALARLAGVARGIPANLPRPNPFRDRSLSGAVSGKVVLITGASSGIGRAAAVKIGAAGGMVLLVARTREKLEEVRDEIESVGGAAHVHPSDLSDLDDIDRMADEVLAEHGRVDILINNAGRSIRRSIALSYDRFHDFERTMQLNYFAPLRLILKLLPGMRERKSGQIVNVSTMGVQTHVPRFSAYVASKAALDEFSRSIASEIVHDDVHISTVYMPLVRTPMIEPTKHYRYFPAITPEDAAEMISEALTKRPKKVSTTIGRLSEVTYATVPRVQDAIANAGYKLFPDTRAARGAEKPALEAPEAAEGAEKAEEAEAVEEGTAEQKAFARVTRGVHW